MSATPADRALPMYPGLLLRAEELSGNFSRAEDLVQDAFEACVRKPPEALTDLELKHWMRQVIFNLNALAYRRSEEAANEETGRPALRMRAVVVRGRVHGAALRSASLAGLPLPDVPARVDRPGGRRPPSQSGDL